MDRTSVTVALSGLSDSEKVIFKLIFSVSQRSAARHYRYTLSDEQNIADVCITANPDETMASAAQRYVFGCLLLTDGDINNNENLSIKRPLIASRVLSILDKACEQRHKAAEVSEPSMASASKDIPSSNADEGKLDEYGHAGFAKKEIQEADFNFSISEDEASNLAIVHDESLSNPSNNEMLDELKDVSGGRELSEEAELNSVEMGENQSSPLANSMAAPGVRKKTALVVDDSASVRKQMEIELDLFDVQVDFAEDAERALDLLKERKYHVAFLDVVLPDKDGYHICKAIKQKVETKSTKVIMLTGKATHADKVRGSLSGCDAYLVKPVGREIFQNTVKRYLNRIQDVKLMEA